MEIRFKQSFPIQVRVFKRFVCPEVLEGSREQLRLWLRWAMRGLERGGR